MTGDPKLSELLAEALELEDGSLPPVRETTVSQPNLAKSQVLHVRLSEQDCTALAEAAASLNVTVSDVARSAIHNFLRGNREAEYLAQVLHESGLRIVRA